MTVHQPFERQKAYHREIEDDDPSKVMQAQMYTPETLKAEALARNCYRMVAYDLALPELLDRYAERAAELAGSMEPVQFAVILNAFARSQHRHDKMLKVFTKRMPPRLSHFVPMNYATICNAYAKLREKDEPLFRRFSAEMPHKLPLFEGNQISLVANAYARLSIRDDLLFDDIADEVMRRPQELCHASLLRIANAFGHFKIASSRFWFVLSDWLLQSYLDFTAQDIVNLLNSLSAVDFQHDSLMRALTQSLTDPLMLGELEPSYVGLGLNAMGRLQWSGRGGAEAIQALATRATELAPEADAAVVGQLLHACTKLPELRRNKAMLDALMERSVVLVPTSNAQSLSLLVNSCTKLRLRDVALLTQVAKTIPKRAKEFNPQALAMIAHGFAKLEVRSEILFYLLATQIVAKMPLFTGQGVGMILRAYGKLDIKNDKLVTACRKQVKALADELTPAELDDIEAGFKALDALDPHMEGLLHRTRRQLQAAQSAAAPSAAPSSSRARRERAWAREDGEDDLLHRLAAQDTAAPPFSSADDAGGLAYAVSGPGAALDGGGARGRGGRDEEEVPAAVGREGRKATRQAEASEADRDHNLWELWGAEGSSKSRPAAGGRRREEEEEEDPWVLGQSVGGGGGGGSGRAHTSSGRARRTDDDDATPPQGLRNYLAQASRPGRRPVVLDTADGEEARSASRRGAGGSESAGGESGSGGGRRHMRRKAAAGAADGWE